MMKSFVVYKAKGAKETDTKLKAESMAATLQILQSFLFISTIFVSCEGKISSVYIFRLSQFAKFHIFTEQHM